MKKVALVTGSSRGIGAATAALLAESGYAVCINYIEQKEKALELEALLRFEGCEVMSWQADVADSEAVKAMVQAIEENFGPVTLLVNNAGIAMQQQFQDIEPGTWKRMFDVNLGGCFNTIQAVLPPQHPQWRTSTMSPPLTIIPTWPCGAFSLSGFSPPPLSPERKKQKTEKRILYSKCKIFRLNWGESKEGAPSLVVSNRGDYQEGEESEIFPLLICFFAYFLVNTRKYGPRIPTGKTT